MNEYYHEAKGEAYLKQRSSSSRPYVQAIRASLFSDIVSPGQSIVDFGCGTGGILSHLPASRRVGIEVSESAAKIARMAGIEVYATPEILPARSFDLAISFHAIEHVDCPLETLRAISRLVSVSGRIRLIVPCETPLALIHRRWSENTYRHLHTWTPLLFGNLAQRAGYRDIRARLVPMPSASRLSKLMAGSPRLSHWIRMTRSIKENKLNVVLDARPSVGN